MLVLSSRHEHTMPALEKPRVISELKKTKKNGKCELESKPRISGELEWAVGGAWELRHVEVRDGSLVGYSTPAGPKFRLPLRHLSLQSANHPHAFSLVREHQPIVTLLAATDEEYERWVKTLAVELMRQTPLEAIRFLDILGITATIARTRGYEEEAGCLSRRASEGSGIPLVNSEDDSLIREGFHSSRKSSRFECEKDCTTNGERGRAKRRVRVNTCVSECGERRLVRAHSSGPKYKVSDSDSDLEDVDEKEMTALLRRCQQVENYVPVSEKRRLFESLSRWGRRLAQSSDNLCSPAGNAAVKVKRKKRTRSLHDLSRSSVAVRDMCRYFETRGRLVQEEEGHKNSMESCNENLNRRHVRKLLSRNIRPQNVKKRSGGYSKSWQPLIAMMIMTVPVLVPDTSMVRLSSQSSKNEGACSKAEKLQKKLREKTPIGKLDELDEGKHPYQEKEPLPPWPNNTNPATGEVGGPRGPEPTRYGDWERKGRVSDF